MPWPSESAITQKQLELLAGMEFEKRYTTSPADHLMIMKYRKHWSDLPEYVYRVFGGISPCYYHEEVGFLSKAFFCIPGGFTEALVNWYTHAMVTPFISLCSSEKKARQWAADQKNNAIVGSVNAQKVVKIAKINTKILCEAAANCGIFRTEEILGCLSQEQRNRFSDSALPLLGYFSIWYIPKCAIEEVIDFAPGNSFRDNDLGLLMGNISMGKAPLATETAESQGRKITTETAAVSTWDPRPV